MEQKVWHNVEAYHMCVSSFLGSRKKKMYYKAHVAEKYKLNVKRIINNNRNEYFA